MKKPTTAPTPQYTWVYFVFWLVPKVWVSRLAGFVADLPLPPWLLQRLLKFYIELFQVNMDESLKPASSFHSFNEFFTRQLKPNCRPVNAEPKALVSPVDAAVGAMGTIRKGKLIQAKGLSYSVEALLDDPTALSRYEGGRYLTLYLSPSDYHRIHAPCDLKIQRYTYRPGTLWTVSPWGVQRVPRLFARNERVITWFEMPTGEAALVKVGAVIVGRIKVSHCSLPVNPWWRRRKTIPLSPPASVAKGEEIGRFELGSTVILVFGKDQVDLPKMEEGTQVKMGQQIGTLL